MHKLAVETSIIFRMKMNHAIPSADMVTLTLFFDCCGHWLIDWLPKGITVNANHYAETLEQLRSIKETKRPRMLSCGVIFLHDNARPHPARTTHEKLQHFQWDVLPHPSYNPHLSPSDYHVFGPMKKAQKGQCFAMDTKVQEAITSWLHWQLQDFHRHGTDRLVELWDACLNKHGALAE